MDITAPRPSAVPTRSSILDRALNLAVVNWEVVYFVGLMVVVLLTRLLMLDTGALHHDESIHGYYSYQLFTGKFAYHYDPTYHGPFLYHAVALMFFFFGASDYTVRLAPAIFGIALIALMWAFRPFLGRWGALAAATFMTFSPDIMYYSRHLRHDIFSTVGTMLMLLGILGFIRTHKARYMYLAALGVGLGITNHELIYLNGVIFVTFLIFAFLYEQFINTAKASEQRPLLLAFRSLIAQPMAIGFALLILVGFIVLFYSSFLTNMGQVGDFVKGITYWQTQQGVARGDQPWYYFFIQLAVYDPILIFFGIAGGIYLIIRQAQHKLYDVAAETDPTPDVQPAPSLPTQLSVVELITPLLGYWAVGAIIIYSIAGEKMPWLTMQISIPLAMLGGMALGRILKNTDWSRFWRSGGVWSILTIILIGFALVAFRDSLAAPYANPATPTAAEQSAHLLRSLLTAIAIVIMVGLLMYWYGKLGLKHSWLTFLFAVGMVLGIYGIHSATELNFYNADNPSELQVYVQTSPDVPIVAQRILRLSRDETAFTKRNADDPTGGHSLDIALDNQVEWPWDWYFRDQKGYFYFNDTSPLSKPPSVVISRTESDVNGQQVVQQVEQTLGGNYIKQKYKLRWWFPEELYKNLDATKPSFELNQIITNLTTASNWPNIGNYFFFRKTQNPLGSTDFYLYVRADLAAKIGMGGTTVGGTPSNPNQNGQGSASGTINGSATGAISGTNSSPVASGPAHNMLEMSEGKGNGQFESPRAIAAAPDGSFYVLDTGNGRVQHFDANGKFLNAFGQPSNADQGNSGQSNPNYKPPQNGYLGVLPSTSGGANGIAVDKQSNVYVADTWYHRIQKFDKDGKFLLTFGQSGYTGGNPTQDANPDNNERMFGPRGVAVSDTGEIYVTDTGDKRVLVFDQNGKYARQFGVCKSLGKDAQGNDKLDCTGALDEPIGIAINSQTGIVFVADTRNHRIAEFKTDGSWVKSFAVADNGWQSARFMEPQLALDAQGNLYVPDPTSANADVVKYSPDGQKLGQKSKEQGSSLVNPTGVTIDHAGNIYITDPVQQGVIKFSPIK